MEVSGSAKNKTKDKEIIWVKAYKGDAMTLLCFDLDETMTTDFAGFSIAVTQNHRPKYFLNNRLAFNDAILAKNNITAKQKYTSEFSPFQKFRWVHAPSSEHFIDEPYYGDYTYEISPRYLKNEILQPIDPDYTVSITIYVGPFRSGDLQVGFTRGFISSEAYMGRFGNNGHTRPKGNTDLLFDVNAISGTVKRWNNEARQYQDTNYSFEEQFKYLGWQARERIMEFLEEVNDNPELTLDVFAFDLDEPLIAAQLLELAKQGRLRIILDDSKTHSTAGCTEEQFDQKFKAAATGNSGIRRGHYISLAHSKVFIQRNKADKKAVKVLTGSTNFSTNGIYINANHVIIFKNPTVAQWYADAFDVSFSAAVMKGFKKDPIAQKDFVIAEANLPAGTIRFSPHPAAVAGVFFKSISERIAKADSDVLFAIMDDKSASKILAAVEAQVKSDKIFTYGITDRIKRVDDENPGDEGDYGVYMYKPNTKNGIRVAGSGAETQLPPPFNEVPPTPGISIHHKFIVVDFKGTLPVVYCGSSNLAYGPEQANGDNLIEIRDIDVVTCFAIEAIRLVDHFQWRNKKFTADQANTPVTLNDNSNPDKIWYKSYYNSNDLLYLERTIFVK